MRPFVHPAHSLRARFLILFAGGMGTLAWIFDRWQSFFDRVYLYPVSWTSAALLNLIGLPARLDANLISGGFCLLSFERCCFRIIPECTGIFAFFIFLSALLAYPASLPRKLRVLLLFSPLFFAYGVLRLVALGVVAHFTPDWLQSIHLYLMVLLNLGFLAAAWTACVNKVLRYDRPS